MSLLQPGPSLGPLRQPAQEGPSTLEKRSLTKVIFLVHHPPQLAHSQAEMGATPLQTAILEPRLINLPVSKVPNWELSPLVQKGTYIT